MIDVTNNRLKILTVVFERATKHSDGIIEVEYKLKNQDESDPLIFNKKGVPKLVDQEKKEKFSKNEKDLINA